TAANSFAKLSWTAALAGASSAALAMRTNASSKRPWSRIASPSAHEIAGLQTGELRPFLDDLKRTFARLGHTERMRLFRRRRKFRRQVVTVEVDPREVDALIDRGYLDPKDRDDLVALAAAVNACFSDDLMTP